MTPRQLHRTAGDFLVAIPGAFIVCFTLLGQPFAYPEILRPPTGAVLTPFQAGSADLIAVW